MSRTILCRIPKGSIYLFWLTLIHRLRGGVSDAQCFTIRNSIYKKRMTSFKKQRGYPEPHTLISTTTLSDNVHKGRKQDRGHKQPCSDLECVRKCLCDKKKASPCLCFRLSPRSQRT